MNGFSAILEVELLGQTPKPRMEKSQIWHGASWCKPGVKGASLKKFSALQKRSMQSILEVETVFSYYTKTSSVLDHSYQ